MDGISHKFEFVATSSHVYCKTSTDYAICHFTNLSGSKVCDKKSVCDKMVVDQNYYVVVEENSHDSNKYFGDVTYQGKF